MKNIKLLVVAHKDYEMPQEGIYLPISVGPNKDKLPKSFQRDDEGDNIASKNYCYCELTALYWGWKHLECDVMGLVHYRRHFKNKSCGGKKFSNVISGAKIEKLLKEDIILLPKKRHYYIETNKSQYLHAHHKEGLENTEKVIKDKYPEYLESWNKMLKKRSGHRFNMYIMSKEKSDAYCKWLFDILFEVEKMTDISNWDASEQRVFGYLSERLLDVWLFKNKYKTKDIPYYFMEKQNWFKKIGKFLKRFITKGKKK